MRAIQFAVVLQLLASIASGAGVKIRKARAFNQNDRFQVLKKSAASPTANFYDTFGAFIPTGGTVVALTHFSLSAKPAIGDLFVANENSASTYEEQATSFVARDLAEVSCTFEDSSYYRLTVEFQTAPTSTALGVTYNSTYPGKVWSASYSSGCPTDPTDENWWLESTTDTANPIELNYIIEAEGCYMATAEDGKSYDIYFTYADSGSCNVTRLTAP